MVNSERQLWSVAGYLSMVVEGVFGVQDDGRVQPKLPAVLVPELFGNQRRISLEADGRRYVLERPKQVVMACWWRAGEDPWRHHHRAAGAAAAHGDDGRRRCARTGPAAPQVQRKGRGWNVVVAAGQVLWQDGRALAASNGLAHRCRWPAALPQPDPARRCN